MINLDLAPLVNGVIVPLLIPVILAFASWAITRIAAVAHFQLLDGQRRLLEQAITNGLAYVEKTLGPHETVSVDAKVAGVVNYVAPKVPGALKSLGITGDHLAQLVTARLPT